MGRRVGGLGFMVQGLLLGAWGPWFRDWGLVFEILRFEGLGFRVLSVGFQGWGLEY